MTSKCYGCENNILNQEGHMGFNGCLADPPNIYYLYTDGACRGNPGRSGGGAVIYDYNMNEIASKSTYFGIMSNNQSEYRALMEGINLCQELFIDLENVILRMDSLLIVNQLKGKFAVKSSNLIDLFKTVKDNNFKSIEHVYRKDNKRADELANKSLDK